MGIYLKRNIDNDTVIGIWEMVETIDHYTVELRLDANELNELNNFKSKRRKHQWLAVQLLLKNMLSLEKIKINYDEYGKPFLSDSGANISISHSGNLAVILLSETKEPGVDIEKINPKIEKIAPKFMSDYEFRVNENLSGEAKIEHMHVVWGAKESLFKLYGRGNLHFKENLLVEPFDYKCQGVINARISKDNSVQKYSLSYEKIMDYMLVYVLNK